ncbi:MAG TPA: cysteine desulfurase-like protein [Gemmatimonadaceae bacterium]|nr:cysteine desulfurase-like protein [Gemmatimonadaceae bacterium]
MSTSEARPHESVEGISSLAEIRSQFPALRRTHRGRPVAFFDGPGGTQVPVSVIDAMVEYLRDHNANTHWNYPTSQETDEIIEGARAAVADLVNASSMEIAFGLNMTALTFHVARALGRMWKAGDEIIVTELDHHANVAPWRELERERGVSVKSVPFDPETGELVWSALEEALSSRTRLIALGAASNALGTVNDVRRAASLARDAGALLFVDAVHFAAHGVLDVRAMGCDFLACSAYKFYGPHLGILYCREDLLGQLPVPKLAPAPDAGPERLETGTQNHEGIAGARAAVEFLASLAGSGTRRQRLVTAMRGLHTRGEALGRRLWEGLTAIPGVRCYGPPPGRPRTPTVAFAVEGMSSASVSAALAEEALFVSHGDFYAATVVERLGRSSDGLVRVGCACYTTDEEVDRLLRAVERIAAGKLEPAGELLR